MLQRLVRSHPWRHHRYHHFYSSSSSLLYLSAQPPLPSSDGRSLPSPRSFFHPPHVFSSHGVLTSNRHGMLNYSTAVSDQALDEEMPVEKQPSEPVLRLQKIIQICEILEAKTWGIATSKRLEALDISYTSDIVASVVRSASSSTAALGFFNWLTLRGFEQDSHTYGAIIDVLGEVGSIEDMKYLADEMKKSALVVDADLYDSLVYWCARHSDSVGAESFAEQMNQEGILLSPSTYTSLFDLRIKEGKYEDAVTLYLQMIEEGVLPMSQTFNSLIRCLLEAGKLDSAQTIFTSLTKVKVKPPMSSFAYLMAAHAKVGNQDLLCSLGKEMRNLYGRPGKVFHIAFKLLQKEGKMEVAEAFAKEVWPELSDEQRSLIAQDVGGVSLTLYESEKEAFKDDLGHLLSPKVRVSLSEAARILESEGFSALLQFKLDWSPDAVYKFLKLLQKTDLAWEYFKWLKSDSNFIHDTSNEIYMLRELVKSSNMHAMKELLCEMQSRNARISLEVFNTLIKDCAHVKDASTAVWVYSKIKDSNLQPNEETFSSLVHALARGRNPDKASDLCTVMQDVGIRPDVETYTAVIHSLGLAGRSDDAWSVYQKMLASGHKPSVNTYTALLNMMNVVGDPGFAIKLYKEMNANGIAPTEATQGIMAKIWEASGNAEEAQKLETQRRFLSSKRREDSLQQIYEVLLEGLVEQERSPSLLCL